MAEKEDAKKTQHRFPHVKFLAGASRKGMCVGLGAAVIAAAAVLVLLPKPATARLFNMAITDEQERNKILASLAQDNVKAHVSADGIISVDNEATARKWRSRLIAEGLEPLSADAYTLFDVRKWTRDDFDDTVNWQRATTAALEDHLQQLGGIQKAKVMLLPDFGNELKAKGIIISEVFFTKNETDIASINDALEAEDMLSLPDDELFKEEQNPVTTASVVLWASAGSSVLQDKRQVEGIQHLIMRSVEGLKEEDITIVDGSTNEEIKGFEGMEAADQLTPLQEQQKLIRKQETEYSSAILNQLKGTYGVDRVNITNMRIAMTTSGDSEASMGKRTVSVNVDGTWAKRYDSKGNFVIENRHITREYNPLTDAELKLIEKVVQDVIGYSKARGDSVTVTNIAFDRTAQFEAEDMAFFKAQQTKRTIRLVLLGAGAAATVTFIAIRCIKRKKAKAKK